MAIQKRGHIKVARREFLDKLWAEKRIFSKWEAVMDMTQLAQWEAREFTSTKFGTIRLERGEFILSLRKMADRWGWGLQSVRSFTRSATFCTRVATQRETQAGTVYLIRDYDVSQSGDGEVTQQITQPATHPQHTSNTRGKQLSSKELTTTTSPDSHESGNNGSTNGTHRPLKSLSWPGEGAAIWCERVGPITPPKFGRILKPMVDAHGWPTCLAAMLAYIELTEGRARQLQWLVNDAVRWIALGKQEMLDENGDLTERGRLAQRSA